MSRLTSLILFDTYLELRGQSGGTTLTSINVAISRDAGISGWFAWSTDTASLDDGGTIVVPKATPRMGCWKRVFQGGLSVRWFGALGDGVDDNDAVEAAVVRANSLNVPVKRCVGLSPRHATGDTKMMYPYRGRELKTKGLHWKRMKGLKAVRRSERTYYLGGELCDEHLKELNSI
jgi:hypothetical protein